MEFEAHLLFFPKKSTPYFKERILQFGGLHRRHPKPGGQLKIENGRNWSEAPVIARAIARSNSLKTKALDCFTPFAMT